MSAALVPAIIVVLPVEGEATARILSSSYEEELRVGLELWDRDTILKIALALGRLGEALLRQEEGS